MSTSSTPGQTIFAAWSAPSPSSTNMVPENVPAKNSSVPSPVGTKRPWPTQLATAFTVRSSAAQPVVADAASAAAITAAVTTRFTVMLRLAARRSGHDALAHEHEGAVGLAGGGRHLAALLVD